MKKYLVVYLAYLLGFGLGIYVILQQGKRSSP